MEGEIININYKEPSLTNEDLPLKETTPEVIKDLLLQEKNRQEIEKAQEGINWLDNEYYDNEDKVKSHNKELLKLSTTKLFFLAHHQDRIKGKPEFFGEHLQTISLVQKYHVQEKKKGVVVDEYDKYFLLGERADKRYDGYPVGSLNEKFRLYKTVHNQEEIIIFVPQSLGELPNEVLYLKGMKIQLDDLQEMTRNLKIKKITTTFLLHSYESTVQTLPPKELVELVKSGKEQGITAESFKELLQTHPNGNIYPLSEEVDALRIARLLSGKKDGYPLHLHIIGQAGTGKTTILEIEQALFQEEQEILEGANTTPKGLSPSFKEIPADIGFIAKSNRITLIDELFKMIQNQINKERQAGGSYLGDLNFLLEHKKRTVTSGNKNSCTVQATSKILLCSNPLPNRVNLGDHLRVVDPSTMSRLMTWVQDEQETAQIFSKDRVKKLANTYTSIYTHFPIIQNNKNEVVSRLCSRKSIGIDSSINLFLTIYDSCQTFNSVINPSSLKALIQKVTAHAREPLKTSVWLPRAEHHTYLLVDGLCKYRCLFKDYDPTFTAKDEDYELAERILARMVKGWDTSLIPRGTS